MKKKWKYGLHIIVSVAAIAIFCVGYSKYLDVKIDELYNSRIVTVNHVNGLAEKDKGNALIAKTMTDGNMLVMGSSELSSPVPENLKNLFPNNLYNRDISCVGHASVQNSLHAMNLGANYTSLNKHDIVIVESLQWFQGDEISISGYFSNFSELQFYEFLHNERLSEDSKSYLCERYIQLENAAENSLYSNIKQYAKGNEILELADMLLFSKMERAGYSLASGELTFPQTYVLARLYSSNSLGGKVLYCGMSPYFWLRNNILKLKDKYVSYKWLSDVSESTVNEPEFIDWMNIYSTAESEGELACKNNDIYVYDDYYTNYLQDRWEELKDRNYNDSLLRSNEWNDYKFFLQVCTELDLHPYIVIMSTNGLYYDYIGLNCNKRQAYYLRMEETAKQYGMDCLNLQEKEYQPYFYCDVMHLGWKGWPYVVQNIIEHFA